MPDTDTKFAPTGKQDDEFRKFRRQSPYPFEVNCNINTFDSVFWTLLMTKHVISRPTETYQSYFGPKTIFWFISETRGKIRAGTHKELELLCGGGAGAGRSIASEVKLFAMQL